MKQISRVMIARRLWIFLIVAVAGLATLAGLAVPSGGPWIATGAGHCPPDTICADWDLDGGGEWASCCIPVNEEGYYNISACNEDFRHFDGI